MFIKGSIFVFVPVQNLVPDHSVSHDLTANRSVN